MRELSTVNMGRNDAESIQWNWKWVRALALLPSLYQRIHSMELKVKKSQASSVSPALRDPRIHSMELKAGGADEPCMACRKGRAGIHSMELKDYYINQRTARDNEIVESIQWNWKDMAALTSSLTYRVAVNPFNGIERAASGSVSCGSHSLDESIQWNWKTLWLI